MTLPGFMLCETCGGAGILEPPISGNDPHGAFANAPCPDCGGTGQVPHPDTMDSVADALANLPYDTLGRPYIWGEESIARVEWLVARIALVAYARRVLAEGGEG